MALPSKQFDKSGWMVVSFIGTFMLAMGLGVTLTNFLLSQNTGMTVAEIRQEIKKCEASLPRNQYCTATVTVKVKDNVESVEAAP